MRFRSYACIIFSLIPVVLVYFMIFGFSSQTAEDSSKISGEITDTAVRILIPSYDSLDIDTQAQLYGKAEHVIRKLAHFTEFGMLGFFLILHICAIAQKRPISFPIRCAIAFIITFVSASFDELHQMSVDGRSPMFTDVIIDSIGGLAGILFFCLIVFFINKLKKAVITKRKL